MIGRRSVFQSGCRARRRRIRVSSEAFLPCGCAGRENFKDGSRLMNTNPDRRGIVLLLILTLLCTAPRGVVPTARERGVRDGGNTGGCGQFSGEAATARLKQAGHYGSFVQAVQMARYVVETVDQPAAPGGAGECYASNPAQTLRCWFRADGLELQPAETSTPLWKMKLRLLGYGRATLAPAEVDEVSFRHNRAELSRANGAVVEWYENRAAGLEQGFIVRSAPAGDGPLRLVLGAEGDLRPELDPASASAKFSSTDGQTVLRYGGLKVWDARQRQLAAWLEVKDRQLDLVVNDAAATYPVTIDPLITSPQSHLASGDGAPGDNFGYSVSLSRDGNTALVAAHNDDTAAGTDAGSVYVFVRNGSIWSREARLTASDAAANDLFGYAVSLSDDGNTALIGAGGDDNYQGSAYVFIRSGSGWSQEAKLTASDGVAGDFFGSGASLSESGDVALVGAHRDDTTAGSDAGSAYVFVRTGGIWSEQARLTAADGAANDFFGCGVSISDDGSTALMGAYPDESLSGSAYVFVRSGSSWSQQAKLTMSDGLPSDYFGWSVCLGGDGNTALVGARNDDGGRGSAIVFVRSGSNWSQQAKLAASDRSTGDQFGWSVGLSGDGSTALVGSPYDDVTAGADAGSAYLFVRSGSSWSQQAKLTAGDGGANDSIGQAVTLSGDGDTALLGACFDETTAGLRAGSAYVWLRNGSSWNQEARLSAGDGAASDYFGVSVALSDDGNTALVSASHDDTSRGVDVGSVYVFVRSGAFWMPQAKLTADDGAAGDQLGYSIALSGDGNTALAGASLSDSVAGNAGCAYVFVRSGSSWSQQAKLTASDGGNSDDFGISVSLSSNGDTALVGAELDNTAAGADAGSAYVFVRTDGSWSQQARLTASDGAVADDFGWSVALSGDGNTALIGAYWDDTTGGPEAGSAYVFVRSGGSWTEQTRLTASDGVAGDKFGVSVGLNTDGNTAIVGAYYDNTPAGADSGSAYVFLRNGTSWSEQARLTSSDGAASDLFGRSVSLSQDGNRALVGAYYDDTSAGVNAGSAYLFVRSGSSWSEQGKLTASDGAANDAFGCSVALSRDGRTALVGAFLHEGTEGDLDVGSAYVFLVDNPPRAELATYNRSTNLALRISVTNLLARFTSDPENDPRTLSAVRSGTNHASIWKDASYIYYEPSDTDPNRNTTDHFGYEISDGWGGVATNLVRVTVVAGGDPGSQSPNLIGVSPFGGHNFIKFRGIPGYAYRVQRTTALNGAETVWTDLGTATELSTGFYQLEDTSPPETAFYRTVWP